MKDSTLRGSWLEAQHIADSAFVDYQRADREVSISNGCNGRLKGNAYAARKLWVDAEFLIEKAYQKYKQICK